MERNEIIRALVEIRDREFLFARQYLADAGIDLVNAPQEAKSYLETKANAGFPEAQLALSKLLLTPLIGPRDRAKAFAWCNSSAEAGYVPALVLLSAFYTQGWCVQRDDIRAISLLAQAAEEGYAHAAALLATAFSGGIRVPIDREKGQKFLVQAAEGGDANSQFMLGLELLKSTDEEERKAGPRWLLLAADQDLVSAHQELAHLYREGDAGLPLDDAKSRFHQQRADELQYGAQG